MHSDFIAYGALVIVILAGALYLRALRRDSRRRRSPRSARPPVETQRDGGTGEER